VKRFFGISKVMSLVSIFRVNSFVGNLTDFLRDIFDNLLRNVVCMICPGVINKFQEAVLSLVVVRVISNKLEKAVLSLVVVRVISISMIAIVEMLDDFLAAIDSFVEMFNRWLAMILRLS
jgi:hypothetical protein